MTHFPLPRRTRQHLGALLVLFGLLGAYLPSVVWAPTADAALPPATNVGGFEIDGNLLSDNAVPDTVPGTRDWDVAPAPNSDAFAANDDILIQGNNGGKEDSDPYVFDTGNVNAKDDLTKVYVDHRITGPTDAFIWAGFERLSGVGSAHVIFEFNQAPVAQFHLRQAGDLRVSFAFGGQGANENASTVIETWNGSSWVASGASGVATVNSATNQPPLGTVTTPDGRTLLEREFGEVGVNLASYFTNQNFRCANLSTVWARTRASESNTANVFDKAGPYAINVDLCSTIKVKKTDDSGNPMSGVEFTLYKDHATNGTPGSLDAADTAVGTADTDASGIATFSDVDAGDYFVKETEGSLNDYILDTTVVGPITVGFLQTVNVWQDQDGAGPGTTGYTFVNTRKTGKLEVVKALSPTNDGGKFDLFIKQGATTKASADDVGNGGTTGETTLPTGTYSVSEAAGTGTSLGDYVSSVSCVDGDGAGSEVAANANGPNVDVAVGHDDDIVCTITNTRKTGKIELKKELSPDTDLGTFDLYIKDATGTTTIDSELGAGDGDTTGENVVNTGSYQLSEVAPSGVDLSDYSTTISCVNEADLQDTVAPTGTGPWTVAVGHDDDIACTITNTRKTGQLTIVKDLNPSDDPGEFNLTLDGGTEATGGDGTTTGAMTLDTGTYTVSESAGTDTDLADYVTSVSCVEATDGQREANANGPNVDVAVGHDDDITCTITNTRKTGQLTIVKDLNPSDDPGLFDLTLDDGAEATDVGDAGTTGAMTLNTGTYTVSEDAGTDTTLDDYVTSVSCVDEGGTGTEVASNATGPNVDVSVGHDDDIVCTITNTRKTGQLTIVKDLNPSDDPGLFDLTLDNGAEATDVGDAGTTGAMTLNTGTYTVSEDAGTDTTLDDYVTSVSCVDEGGTGTEVASNATGPNVDVSVGHDDDIVCTITNTRKTGNLELVKDLAPDDDPGTFDLFIKDATGTTTIASALDVGDGGTTGETEVNTGTYELSESAAAGTDLSNYTPTISCVLDGTSTAVTVNGSGPWTVDVAHDVDIVCTIMNARQTGTLTVVKDLSPTEDPGLFDLSIDDVDLATDVGHGGSTGATTVNTGSHTVGESAGTGTTLDDYDSVITCVLATQEGDAVIATGTGTSLSVSVGYQEDVTCTVFNTRKTGDLTIVKDLSPDTDDGTFNLTLDDEVVAGPVGDGGTTGAMELNTGTYTVGETATGSSVLSDYTSSVSCVDGDQVVASSSGTSVSVDVTQDADIVCTISNTRIPHDLTLIKVDGETQAPLAGAGFTLYSSDGDSDFEPGEGDTALGDERTTDTNGEITWTDLQPGSYWVAETTTPPGYFTADPRLVVIDDADVTITVSDQPHSPAISLTKAADPIVVNVDGSVTYTYVITNTGDVTLTDVTLVDDVLGTILGEGGDLPLTLEPGQFIELSVNQTFTEADLPGPVVNVADTQGTAPDGSTVDDQATATVDLTSNPGIEVVKTSSTGGAEAGDTITYTYEVTNTGDVTLTGVTAVDDILGPITLADTTLAPGASTTGTATHTVTEADLPGPIVNVVTVTGTPPVGADVSDTDDEQVSLTSSPAIEIVKTADIEPDASGFKSVNYNANDGDDEVVVYEYLVTNTGDVTLTNVTVDDDVLGTITLADTTLDPGESTTGSAIHFVTEADNLEGAIVNVAVATGTAPDGTEVDDQDDEEVFVIEVLPTIIERPEPEPAPELPVTGFDSDDLTALATGMLALGLLLLLSTQVEDRRRRRGEAG